MHYLALDAFDGIDRACPRLNIFNRLYAVTFAILDRTTSTEIEGWRGLQRCFRSSSSTNTLGKTGLRGPSCFPTHVSAHRPIAGHPALISCFNAVKCRRLVSLSPVDRGVFPTRGDWKKRSPQYRNQAMRNTCLAGFGARPRESWRAPPRFRYARCTSCGRRRPRSRTAATGRSCPSSTTRWPSACAPRRSRMKGASPSGNTSCGKSSRSRSTPKNVSRRSMRVTGR